MKNKKLGQCTSRVPCRAQSCTGFGDKGLEGGHSLKDVDAVVTCIRKLGCEYDGMGKMLKTLGDTIELDYAKHAAALKVRDERIKELRQNECEGVDVTGDPQAGKEAEELRKGIEKIIDGDLTVQTADDLQKLLDSVDARDSLSWLERWDHALKYLEQAAKWLSGTEVNVRAKVELAAYIRQFVAVTRKRKPLVKG